MVRRINVTGAGGLRLAAWEYGDPPKGSADSGGARAVADGRRRGAADGAPPGGGPQNRPGVLLLHGLMGRASHWANTARWLSARFRAIALDQRGHGRSDKPGDGSFDRDSYVADAATAIEQLDLAPVVVVGHSMGALTGWQLAARRPDLVRGLVICDMRASALGAASQREWEEWYRSWPVPFATLADVRKWFGEDDPVLERPRPVRGEFYAEVMAERADGWRPVFSRRQMLRARETWVHDAHWEELALVQCPTLVVRGIDGELGRAEAQEMVRVLPHGIYAELDAGHLLHLEDPEAFHGALEPFLEDVTEE